MNWLKTVNWPLVDRQHFEIEDVTDAHAYLESGEPIGKLFSLGSFVDQLDPMFNRVISPGGQVKLASHVGSSNNRRSGGLE